MILNLSKIKTESLLLICRDLILSYKDNEDIQTYGLDNEVSKNFNSVSQDILKEIQKVTFKDEYYIKNQKHYRVRAIIDAYNFINKELSKELKKDEVFNPSMLYFSLLAVWFKELNKESKSKEYIYFIIYPYSHTYDKLLLNIQSIEFKNMNIKMLELAEKIIFKLDKYSFR